MYKCRLCEKELFRDKWGRQKKIFCDYKCQRSWMKTEDGKIVWKKAQEINIPLLKERIGNKNPAWKNAAQRKPWMNAGYIMIPVDNHPFGGKYKKAILEHRLKMEIYLRTKKPDHVSLVEINGQKHLSPQWIVHHKNGVKTDNRIVNLQVLYHTRHHYGYDLICPHCKKRVI